jgi:hypothetical protein
MSTETRNHDQALSCQLNASTVGSWWRAGDHGGTRCRSRAAWLGIGAQRSGTTWLTQLLVQHPQMYADQLDVWANFVGRDRLLVMTYEWAVKEPQAACDRVWAALGLEPSALQTGQTRVRNSTTGDLVGWNADGGNPALRPTGGSPGQRMGHGHLILGELPLKRRGGSSSRS